MDHNHSLINRLEENNLYTYTLTNILSPIIKSTSFSSIDFDENIKEDYISGFKYQDSSYARNRILMNELGEYDTSK